MRRIRKPPRPRPTPQVSRAYFDAEFGPAEHTATIGSTEAGKVPAFLVPGLIKWSPCDDCCTPFTCEEDPDLDRCP